MLQSSSHAESVILLPPRYTIRSLHQEFMHCNDLLVSIGTFSNVLSKDLPHFRVSLRKRGMCDICFVYREAVRKSPKQKVMEKAEEWQVHLMLVE